MSQSETPWACEGSEYDQLRRHKIIIKDLLTICCRPGMDITDRAAHATRIAYKAGVEFSPLRGGDWRELAYEAERNEGTE